MASALVSNPYGQPAYGYVQQHQAPQPPPSPPMDESKCSLPSISNLLGLADAGSPTSETSPQNQQSSPVPQHQPAPQQAASPAPSRPETRPSSAHYSQPTMLRGGMPPTPPMSSEASFDGYPSPATKSVSGLSVVSGHNYYYETTPPLEEPRHMTPVMQQRMPVQTSYPQQSFTGSPYMTQPTLASYYPPMQPTPPPPQPQISGLYYQRPLPQQFPPMGHHHAHAVSVGLGGHPHHHHASGSANPWQHHHYISPQSAASFPQSQDRYICQTCNKAFSRPSSLRIHSHSHTGEKPFKCPHPGCGKAFSVRSNMKRHERGCHNFESTTSSPLVS